VFSNWDFEDSDSFEGTSKLAETSTKIIPESVYEYAGGSVSVILSKPIAGEISSYSISFTPEIKIDSQLGCELKITFPDEIDTTNVKLKSIEVKGMLAD
jgi:hypothetical protein